MIQCQRINHTYQIEFICVNKVCDKRLFCQNCPNLNMDCQIYTKTELLTLLEKNLKYYTQDINEYKQALEILPSNYRNLKFTEMITYIQNEIELLQGIIQLLNYLILQTKNECYDVNKIDQYFQINNVSGPINKLKQFCKSFAYLSQLELIYYQYEINTRFKCKENRKVQIYNYKDQTIQPQQHQNIVLQVMRKKGSDLNFNPSICKISNDEKIIMIFQIFEQCVKLVAWKARDPKKKIKKFKFSQKLQQFEFSTNSRFIYVWDSKGCLQLFKLFNMKKIWKQQFNRKVITFVRQGQQNRLIICFDKRQIQIYSHNTTLQMVIQMKFCDYSYQLALLLTRNKDTSSINIFSMNSLQQTIINSKLCSLKSYCFINQQQQIGVYNQYEMKFKIYDILLPQIMLNIVYAIEFDYIIEMVLFRFENQFIYLITDQGFFIIDVLNMIVKTNQNQMTKGEKFKYRIICSTKSVITYDKKFGIKIQSTQQ